MLYFALPAIDTHDRSINLRARRELFFDDTTCELLGLLGTVTGMIEVFDVMAAAGNSNPRAMASGVSKATIPTMSGMIASLSGVLGSTLLKQKVDTEVGLFEDHLTFDH